MTLLQRCFIPEEHSPATSKLDCRALYNKNELPPQSVINLVVQKYLSWFYKQCYLSNTFDTFCNSNCLCDLSHTTHDWLGGGL